MDSKYKSQIIVIIENIKELKQLKSINGDMDLSDEIRKVNDLLTNLSYDWSIGIEAIFKIWGFYILHSGISTEQKEKDWNTITTFLRALGQLRTHTDYIQTNQYFLNNY